MPAAINCARLATVAPAPVAAPPNVTVRIGRSCMPFSRIHPAKEPLHISNIKFKPGTRKKKRRTAGSYGRGRKGWKHRNGRQRPGRGYEGGQTGIIKLFPKLGRQKRAYIANTLRLRPFSLETLQRWIDSGRIDPSKPITIREIAMSGVAGRVRDGVVLVATGSKFFTTKNINIQVTRASAQAIRAIESLGGTITTVYHNNEIVRAALYPHKYAVIPNLVIPSNPKEFARYMDPERRGYLAPLAAGASSKREAIELVLKKAGVLKNPELVTESS